MGRHQRISSMAEKGRALTRRRLAGKLFAFLLTAILFGLGAWLISCGAAVSCNHYGGVE